MKHIGEYLDHYNETSGKPYRITSSCGYVSTTTDDNFNITQALKEADEMMYVIKKDKKARV